MCSAVGDIAVCCSGPNWTGSSVLKKPDRSYEGINRVLITHGESKYFEMLDYLIGFYKTKFVGKGPPVVPTYDPFNDVSCPVHVYGRVIVVCECQNLLASTIPKCYPVERNCTCKITSMGHAKPMTSKYTSRVVCVIPHFQNDRCGSVDGISRYFPEFSNSMPVFVKLVRYLWIIADDMRVIRAVLGQYTHGALHAVVALFMRLCMSDSCLVINSFHMRSLIDDVPLLSFGGADNFCYEVGYFRARMFRSGFASAYVQGQKLATYKLSRKIGLITFVVQYDTVVRPPKRRKLCHTELDVRAFTVNRPVESVAEKVGVTQESKPKVFDGVALALELGFIPRFNSKGKLRSNAALKRDYRVYVSSHGSIEHLASDYVPPKVHVEPVPLVVQPVAASNVKLVVPKSTGVKSKSKKTKQVSKTATGGSPVVRPGPSMSTAEDWARAVAARAEFDARKPPRVPKSKVRALDTVTPNSDRLLASGAAVYKGVFNERDSELADIERFRDKRPSEPGGKKKKKSGK